MSKVKVLILNYQRLTLCKNMVDWCNQNDFEPVIIDNGSTYKPLLDYYIACNADVLRYDNTHGSRTVWKTDVLKRLGLENKEYIVTDSDLQMPDIPGWELLQVMRYGLEKYSNKSKCGLSLEINDLPVNEMTDDILNRFELAYWQKPLDSLFFDAPVATTFALYRAGATKFTFDAIRINRPYTARHLPWYYEDFESLPRDEKLYFESTNQRWSTVKRRIPA